GGGHLVEEVVLGVAEVDLPLLVLVDADVLNSRFPILIILLHAAADAVHVAAALRDVEGVAVEHPRPRSSGGDVHALAGAELVQALEPLHGVAFSSSVIRRKFPWKYSCQSSVAFSRASADAIGLHAVWKRPSPARRPAAMPPIAVRRSTWRSRS